MLDSAKNYLDANLSSWQRGYDAPNVEGWVFRWNGRILKNKLGITSGKLLDWGCGQGTTVGYFQRQGFDAYGVDIAGPDIAKAATLFPNRIATIDPKPNLKPFFQGVKFDVVVSIQSFYFLSRSDMDIAIESVRSQMNPGAILYATMISIESDFGKRSTPANDGLRKVTVDNERYKTTFYADFIKDKEDLTSRFPGFEPVLIGYYDADWGEGSEKHWTFTGRKI